MFDSSISRAAALLGAESQREELRNKMQKGLLLLNNGSPTVRVYGIDFDVIVQFERFMSRADDATIKKVLEILRE